MALDEKVRQESVRRRLERSEEEYQDFLDLRGAKPRKAVIGAYGSVYNATHALFIEFERTVKNPKSNQSLIKAFHNEFVHTGLFAKKFAAILNRALSLRNDGVYDEEFDLTEENLNDLDDHISRFNREVKRIIGEHQNQA